MTDGNLLAGPPPVLLPEDPEARDALERTVEIADVARQWPSYCAAWGRLAEQAYARGEYVAAYAYARTGYHRGLDQLRRNGWKGHGPVPWSHEPNQGFLRALAALGRAAAAIGEDDEADRCRAFLTDCDPEAAPELADW